jgi:phenylacetate-CoA ligase
MWNRQIEAIDRLELEQLVLRRLRQTIERAKQVPFYQKLLAEANLTASAIKQLSDLEKLPFTKKSDFNDHYPFGLFAKPLNGISRVHASSGTKGKPTVVGYTKTDLSNWSEVCARSLACAGVKPGDMIQNSYGYGLFTGGLGVHYGAEKLGATVIPASGGRTQQQILLLKDLGARILCSTPSYALNIAYALEELGVDLASIKLEIGIFGAEPWTEELRSQLEGKLRIKALDIYGLSEIMGPGVSQECLEGARLKDRSGLHIWEDHFLPEIIDPKTGAALPKGEEGELVFTSLTKEALPLLRYRTGDISRLIPERCPCGRTMVRMARVKARLDDMLIIRGVNVYPLEVEKVLLQVEELSPHYQLILERTKALDSLEIQVEVTDEIVRRWGQFNRTTVDFTALSTKIQCLMKDHLGLSAQVLIMEPRSIPRSEGKAARVIDKRKKT